MRKRQQGGALGTLIVIALLGVGIYYAYTEFVRTTPNAPPPSCKVQLNACSSSCRRTATEAPAMQECQEACQRKAAACKD
jgi:hypothetical protein